MYDNDADHGAFHGVGPAGRPFAVYGAGTQTARHADREGDKGTVGQQLGVHQGFTDRH